jgi:hypothetical protein
VSVGSLANFIQEIEINDRGKKGHHQVTHSHQNHRHYPPVDVKFLITRVLTILDIEPSSHSKISSSEFVLGTLGSAGVLKSTNPTLKEMLQLTVILWGMILQSCLHSLSECGRP